MSWLAMQAYISREQHERSVATMHPLLRRDLVVLDNTETNLGAAGSRNYGGEFLLHDDIDWLVDISPVTRFGPNGGLDFIAALDDHPDAWVVQASTPVNWHCIAWSRRIFEQVGWWDENFWPIYGEDGDMSRRIHLHPDAGEWACVDVDAWVTMYGHSVKVCGVRPDFDLIWSYYRAKWGGMSGAETFTHPFNDPDHDLGWWPKPPDPRAVRYDQ